MVLRVIDLLNMLLSMCRSQDRFLEVPTHVQVTVRRIEDTPVSTSAIAQ